MAAVQFWKVSRAEAGQKLLQFLRRRLEGAVPPPALQRWIRTGQVRVDGSRAKPGTRLEEGQEIRVPPYSVEQAAPPGTPGMSASAKLKPVVVHEDHDLLVLAKPQGLPVHAGTGHHDSVAAGLAVEFAHSSWKPTLVHRLDRDTSGLLVVAKTYSCLRMLHDQWRAGLVNKSYLAWVHGATYWSTPTLLEDAARKVQSDVGERMVVGDGKTCRSLVRTIHHSESCSLVLIAPITGRTHQIRVQLSSRGHPLIGDRKYGGPPRPSGMLLHAWHIRWPGQEFQLLPDWQGTWAISRIASEAVLLQRTRELIAMPGKVDWDCGTGGG
ncbi:23S rRNA pseudouridine955/2504/2580 synthase [Desulfonatronum thiosulfatophilum]|uniref:Ribosomal large subunit pseudouridine synthase C n=1 Tax=Desulfonatronum thiosulfatophilum TaxID=617002 RepID=A0A1G6B9D7_9BACT|nr:RluA family pseudouridine synthase [Desulfonatronum thiosulfatophilum]SDB17073.1 23S rRNA pseudouridine955/2504/2580 synthase [Desulfonatronum thiosulfatophilum]